MKDQSKTSETETFIPRFQKSEKCKIFTTYITDEGLESGTPKESSKSTRTEKPRQPKAGRRLQQSRHRGEPNSQYAHEDGSTPAAVRKTQRTVPHQPAERKWPRLTSGVVGGEGATGGKDHRPVSSGTMWNSAYHLARFKINSREEVDRALGGVGGCSRTQPRTEDTGWKRQCGWRRSRILHSREKAEGQLLVTLRRSQAQTSLPGLNLRPCRGLRLFRRVPLFVTPWTVAHQLL